MCRSQGPWIGFKWMTMVSSTSLTSRLKARRRPQPSLRNTGNFSCTNSSPPKGRLTIDLVRSATLTSGGSGEHPVADASLVLLRIEDRKSGLPQVQVQGAIDPEVVKRELAQAAELVRSESSLQPATPTARSAASRTSAPQAASGRSSNDIHGRSPSSNRWLHHVRRADRSRHCRSRATLPRCCRCRLGQNDRHGRASSVGGWYRTKWSLPTSSG